MADIRKRREATGIFASHMSQPSVGTHFIAVKKKRPEWESLFDDLQDEAQVWRNLEGLRGVEQLRRHATTARCRVQPTERIGGSDDQ